MELLIHSIKLDWPVLLPILICSILTVGVALNRWAFYKDNERDIVSFIRRLRSELVKKKNGYYEELFLNNHGKPITRNGFNFLLNRLLNHLILSL